jgi:hypothetical protein
VAACTIAVALGAGAPPTATGADVVRAHTKVPSPAFAATSFAAMRTTLNAALLASAEHVQTQPCSDFSLESLDDLMRLLVPARAPELQEIYERTADNRRLGHRDLAGFESMWAQERAHLQSADRRKHKALSSGLHHSLVK